ARARAAQRPRVPRRVLAGVARAVALIERAGVAVGGARRAARLLGVDGTCAARRPGTILRRVALAGGPPTHEAAGLHHVGRAAGARPRAHLVGITGVARARAAQRPAVPRRVLASDARAVALVERAWVDVGGARRGARRLRFAAVCAAPRPR